MTGIDPIVTPDALLRWYRNPIARKYDGSKMRCPGRPRTASTIEQLILRMARENPRWGYTRILGALRNLGHDIGRNTIKRILTTHGIEPSTTRRKGTSCETFLKVHWGAIAAADFFTVEARRPGATRLSGATWWDAPVLLSEGGLRAFAFRYHTMCRTRR